MLGSWSLVILSTIMQEKTPYETARFKFRQEQAKAVSIGGKAVESAKKTTKDLPTLGIEEAKKLLEDSDKLVFSEVMEEFKRLRDKLRLKK